METRYRNDIWFQDNIKKIIVFAIIILCAVIFNNKSTCPDPYCEHNAYCTPTLGLDQFFRISNGTCIKKLEHCLK